MEVNFKVRFALHNSCYIHVGSTLDSAMPRKKAIGLFHLIAVQCWVLIPLKVFLFPF